MKRKVLIAISLSVFLIGAGIFTFPFVSIWFNNVSMETISDTFNQSVSQVIDDGRDHNDIKTDDKGYEIDENGNRTSDYPVYTKPDLDRLLKDMRAYNANLIQNQNSLLINENSYVNPCLDLTNYGIYDNCIGYVSAPDIGMKIPIYLGANDYNMEFGATHLTYTSLPLGENTSNVVLAAHTGYIGRIFFDYVPDLSEGADVYIQTFWGDLHYKVKTKLVTESDDVSHLYIEKDKDLLTLMTCHRKEAGVYNRWVVICERAD